MAVSFFAPAALRARLREQPSLDVPFLIILPALLGEMGIVLSVSRQTDAV